MVWPIPSIHPPALLEDRLEDRYERRDERHDTRRDERQRDGRMYARGAADDGYWQGPELWTFLECAVSFRNHKPKM